MKFPWLTIATFCNVGKMPLAPGSWASLVTAGVLYLVGVWARPAASLWLPLATLPVLLLGIPAAARAETLLGKKDPRPVVIDEVAGQMVALWWVPVTPIAYLAGFILFRIFDILKPFPVNWADRRLPGGWGIMTDDILAGLYALGILHLLLPYL